MLGKKQVMIKLSAAIVIVWSLVLALPRLLNYQGKIVDSNGISLNGPRSIAFSIWKHPTSTNSSDSLWGETKTVNIVNGFFDTTLGDVNPLNLDFSLPYYLEIRVWNGFTYERLSPRETLATYSYAFRTLHSDSSSALSTGAVQSDNITIQGDGTTSNKLAIKGAGIGQYGTLTSSNGTVTWTIGPSINQYLKYTTSNGFIWDIPPGNDNWGSGTWTVTDGANSSIVSQGQSVTFTGSGGTSVSQSNRTVTISSIWQQNTQSQNGYVIAGGSNYNKFWGTDGGGNPSWRDLPVNTISQAGIVPAGSGNINKVWGTDASGNPGWRDAPSSLPSGSINQTLRHNGTTWVENSILSVVDIVSTDTVKVIAILDMQKNEAKNMRIEVRTDDPSSPQPGQIWYRSDL